MQLTKLCIRHVEAAPCTAAWAGLLLSVQMMKFEHTEGLHQIDHVTKQTLWESALQMVPSNDQLEANAAHALISFLTETSSHWRVPEMFPLNSPESNHMEL